MKTLVLASLLLSAPAFAATWELDAAHSQVGFSVKHMVVTNVKGQFKQFSGKIDWNEKDATKSTVEVTIDATTIDTNQAKRDEHLKSPDFFDVAKFPTITFKSTKMEKSGKGLKVTGDLTMHGVTKSVVLDVEGPSAPIKSPFGTQVSALHAKTVVKRKDFGLGWNKTLESGGVLVGEEVTIEIDSEIQPAKA